MSLSENLKEIKERYPTIIFNESYWSQIDKGWISIVDKVMSKLSQLKGKEPIEILQIKEKFGELRIHFQADDSIYKQVCNIIYQAEKKSQITCEYCGNRGDLQCEFEDGTKRYYIRTLCTKCNTK